MDQIPIISAIKNIPNQSVSESAFIKLEDYDAAVRASCTARFIKFVGLAFLVSAVVEYQKHTWIWSAAMITASHEMLIIGDNFFNLHCCGSKKRALFVEESKLGNLFNKKLSEQTLSGLWDVYKSTCGATISQYTETEEQSQQKRKAYIFRNTLMERLNILQKFSLWNPKI